MRPPVHKPAHTERRLVRNRWRGSAASRGYDAAWKQFRLGFLKAKPLCADCAATGTLTAATEVHHRRKLRDHPEFRLDAAHAMALCRRCHSSRTANGE